MILRRPGPRFTAAALALLAGVGTCAGQEGDRERLQERVAELQLKNRSLERALVEANRTEKEASAQLAQVRLRLEALGRDLLDGGDERLVEAAADLQVMQERLDEVEARAMNLSAEIGDYLRQAVAADPDARRRVETAMRELDEVLGLRQKPAPASRHSGTASRAKVVSIDTESGLLVLNIGERQGTRIGTLYRLFRGDEAYGTVIVADVRERISGAFVESLDAEQGPVRLGDRAILELQ